MNVTRVCLQFIGVINLVTVQVAFGLFLLDGWLLGQKPLEAMAVQALIGIGWLVVGIWAFRRSA